jgi:hypothetical protein
MLAKRPQLAGPEDMAAKELRAVRQNKNSEE